MLSYVTEMRRELHQYPEIGFDLPRTLALVRRELSRMGIAFSEEYGKSSIVATINPEKTQFTIGIRADMDALPITERTGLSYRSKLRGQMHACGHDAHTAILLDTARQLVEMRDRLSCRVKLIFQSAEEYSPSGAKLMAEDGLMNDIDCVVALHCDVNCDCGRINLLAGAQNAVSNGFLLEFFGKSAHVAAQQDGVDAIMMAVKACVAMEMAVSKELSATTPCVFNVGSIHGGKSNNSICDHTSLFCTMRTWDHETDTKMIGRLKQICRSVAKESGGRFKFTQKKYYPILYNDPTMTELMRASAAAVVGEENIGTHKRTLGGEDFAYFANQKPAVMFRLGIRNAEKGCVASLHQDHFNIDEDALAIGSAVFVRFVLDHMNGQGVPMKEKTEREDLI